MRFLIFQINTNFVLNQLKKILHTIPLLLSPSQNLLETSTFHHSLLASRMNEVCNITNKSRRNSNWAKYKYSYSRDPISFLHFEKKWRSPFLKHLLFNPFSLFLKMSEVCNFIINHLTKYLYTRQLTSLFYFKKKYFKYLLIS